MNAHLTAAPGDVHLACVRNKFENPAATGKDRPVVVIEVTDRGVLVVGLTTQPSYKSTGEQRVGVPNWCAVGLLGPGFIWGSRLTRIDSADLYRKIGRADASLLKCIEKTVHLTNAQRHRLARAAFGDGPFMLPVAAELFLDVTNDDRTTGDDQWPGGRP